MRFEWPDESKRGVILWKVPKKVDLDDEVIVREDEYLIFLDDGKVVSMIDKAGSHRLKADNSVLAPIVSILGGGKKAEAYYIQKAPFDAKFGSKEPFPFRDKEFGMVRLRMFGRFRYHVKDTYNFINQFVGALNYHTADMVERRLREQLVTLIYDTIGDMKEEGMGVADLAANLTNIEAVVLQRALVHFDLYGIKIEKILDLNISMPEEVQKAVDAKASMTVVGTDYTSYQAGKAAADDKRPVIVAEKVRVGDDITIKDSVIQRSEIGHKGEGGPLITAGERTDDSKITVEDSVIIRSELGPGEEIKTDVAIGKGGETCPFCSEKIDLEKPPKFCPNCGKKLKL
jgi:membrane protease subunit (stomatin/prohibitin family)